MSRLRTTAGDERGASIIIVALSLTAIMSMAALVIDIGSGWRNRRALIPGADAAALAAAQDFVAGVDGCATTAPAYLSANAGAGATLVACTPFTYAGGAQGRVTIDAQNNTPTFFAGFVGTPDYPVPATSTAVWGPPLEVTGIAPLMLCYDASPVLQNALATGASVAALEIDWEKNSSSDCGDSRANFEFIDLEGPLYSGEHWHLINWIIDGWDTALGYQNIPVDVCEYPTRDCDRWYFNPEFNDLVSTGRWFWVPVFDNMFDDNPAWQEYVDIVGFVRARVISFDFDGNVDDDLEIQIEPGLISGTCCGSPGAAAGNKVIAICGVDPAAFAACDP